MSMSAVDLASSTGAAAVETLVKGLLSGERRALARAITLCESTKPAHRATAEALVEAVLPHTGRAMRVAVSGPPGAGKSSFIEALGRHDCNFIGTGGHHVAVLAIDPSSQRTGGSILGDKTRMDELARDERAFIRPSPAGATLGGVARRTREAMLLCEAAGYDVVLIETVGVGQSETAAADLVDIFLLLLPPGGGDELQGIKKGIVELADIVVVTKADGPLANAARIAEAEYRHALSLLRPAEKQWSVPVLTCSSTEGNGIGAVWETLGQYHALVTETGFLAKRRAAQAGAALWSEIVDSLVDRVKDDPAIRQSLPRLEADVRDGRDADDAGRGGAADPGPSGAAARLSP